MSTTPEHTEPHRALEVFLGDWHAEGSSYGGDDQSTLNPHAGSTPWTSIHSARWHSGHYFVIQDERANGPFDTLTLMGWDDDAERYFARSIENHGFARDYTMTVDASTWTITGPHERATIVFSSDGNTQRISWEWRPEDGWLPLCDRTAHRIT
ncbi:DUF1579 family protein [Demequina aurantiaca]|uniref:DUF1579 family protein n=1 Tax=Demequina aurantiaca TaxID=676200 RepID=UPI0007853138|nr:DUF1579 family protein [Demequina aurantiaca]